MRFLFDLTKMIWWKPILIFLILISLFTCIDPYDTRIKNFESLLVVDGLLTDEDHANYVFLTRTKANINGAIEKVSGAEVIIKDDLGRGYTLTEKNAGEYLTDSLNFRGEVGRSYILYIRTRDGKSYESGTCLMYPSQKLDSVTYVKESRIIDNEIRDGIKICVTSECNDDKAYYRWTYQEQWKFGVRYAPQYVYLGNGQVDNINSENVICYKGNKSDGIFVRESSASFSQPIEFFLPDESDRFSIKYKIKVRQLSISKDEYNFWTLMQMISESGGDIFDKQPFQITGNIFNKNDATERVLGYFQVSAATEEVKYINHNEMTRLGLHDFSPACDTITLRTSESFKTWDDVYSYGIACGYKFVRPSFDEFEMKITSMFFAGPECTDCSKTGTLNVPDF
jgi:hypothetical protein